MDVAPGTIVVWSDIGCPWAHAAVARLWTARERLGLARDVRFVHRPFPLELVNERPTPYHALAGEIPVVAAIEPDAGWQVWKSDPWTWPVSTLPALEAVQAAAQQSPEAGEALDRALRRALFAESRCITMRHEIRSVAGALAGDVVDVEVLAGALDRGSARGAVIDDWRAAPGLGVKGSPHVFLPDGTDAHNPGVTLRDGTPPGLPAVDADDPSAVDDLLRRAASPT